MKQVQKVKTKTTRRFGGSPFRINARISNPEFLKIKDDYIKANAEATNWPAHDIRAEWQKDGEVLVKWAVTTESESQRQALIELLNQDTHHQILQEKITSNDIDILEVLSVEDAEDHDIPGKSYVMIRDMDVM